MTGLFSLSGLILAFAGLAYGDNKPTVTVYYESLCPDSIRFVTEQLYPNYVSPMKNYFNVMLVPYGKSELISGNDPSTWKFKCHHGERECYGNKVHGCALDRVGDLDKSLKFIVCLMKKAMEDKTAPFPVDECASKSNVNPRDVIQCANDTISGAEVLKKYQTKTDRFMLPLTSVPTVAFNEKYDKEVQDMAVKNFAMALCKHLDSPPHECQHANMAAISTLKALSLTFLVLVPLLF